MINHDNYIVDNVEFGKTISSLIENDNITDIEIRPSYRDKNINFDIWVVNCTKGRYSLNLNVLSINEIEELTNIIQKLPRQLAIKMNVAYNDGNAILDAEFDYKNEYLLRINSIHESLTGSNDIPLISIRKSKYNLNFDKNELISEGYCSEPFFSLMKVLIKSGANIIISGQTGSGKTTLLKFLCKYINKNESIITIEDTREAFLEMLYPDKDIGSLKSTNTYDFETLVKTSLRQNMDWLLVSEVRGREVVDLMNAVSTGHYLISTVHATDAESIPFRMASMAKSNDAETQRLLNQIYRDIDVGIYINYYNDEYGSHRRIQEVCEYYCDEIGNNKAHLIYNYDFDSNKYIINKINSHKIINKFKKRNINTNGVKEFL